MQQLIDIGANLTDKAFKEDYKAVIKTALKHKIKIVITGTSAENSSRGADIALEWPNSIFSTAGIHPHYSHAATSDDINALESLAQLQQVVAIGETGLDFFRMLSPQSIQEQLFEKHIELAAKTNKPMFIHERHAFSRSFEILKAHRDLFSHGVIHCFTGDKTSLFKYLDLDLHIGITGWVCDERRGAELQALLKHIPAAKLMIETDSPYLKPRDLAKNQTNPAYKLKSSRNEPVALRHIAETIAKLRNEDVELLSKHSYETSMKFFNLNHVSTKEYT